MDLLKKYKYATSTPYTTINDTAEIKYHAVWIRLKLSTVNR